MNSKKTSLLLICFLFLTIGCLLGQRKAEKNLKEMQDYLIDHSQILHQELTLIDPLNVPDRKLYIPATELIKYRNGFIVKSTKDDYYMKNTDFYYYNPESSGLHRFWCQGFTSIEDIIVNKEDVYITGENENDFERDYRKLGFRIRQFSNGKYKTLPLKCKNGSIRFKNGWTKLFIMNDNLYALKEVGFFEFEDSLWVQRGNFSFNQFVEMGLISDRPEVPTKVEVTDSTINFIMKRSLFTYNMNDGTLVEFFTNLGLPGSNFPKIQDFTVLEDNSLVILAPYTGVPDGIITSKDGEIINHQIKRIRNYEAFLSSTLVLSKGKKTLLLTENGLHTIQNDTIRSKAIFKCLYFKFLPSAIIELGDDEYAIGGKTGGIVIVKRGRYADWVDTDKPESFIDLSQVKRD
jgi:hypothetical protein